MHEDRCAICGEVVEGDNMAEMYDKAMNDDPEMYSEARSGIVHAQCGIDAGWEVA
jgi:hypothetical protein